MSLSPLRLLSRVLATILVIAIVAAAAIWLLLRGSLPQLDGNVGGLAVSARIERDAAGTPTVSAATRPELAFATGYLHAQDRFFEMDLMRRAAAGELSALLGSATLDTDRQLRVHGFRQIAGKILAQMSAEDRRIFDAYADGVNASLAKMPVRPWEYLVLRAAPRRWSVEDSLLTALSMYVSLNDSTGSDELERAQLQSVLPPALFAFLYPLGTEWDAPMTGNPWRSPPIPGPEILDLREGTAREAALLASPRLAAEPADFAGSNSWAVAGSHAAGGGALLANDMHLDLRLPHIWYRARLVVDGTGRDAPRDLVGVTLPGLPALIVGTNRHVAWGFTNSYGDWTDLVTIEVDPADPRRYLVGDSSEPFTTREERIEVRDDSPVTVKVRSTRWGPIVGRDSQGRPLVLAWTAHDPRATNVRIMDLELATSVEQALSIANIAGAPVQNFIAADDQGHVGWTIMGQVPIRANYDSTVPASWRAPGTGWVGWQVPADYPRLIDPANGRLWTANARSLDAVAWLSFMGDGDCDLGARAAQIRDDLLALQTATAADMAKIQLDDRALFLTRWRDLLLDLLDASALRDHPERQQARVWIEKWSAHAAVDDVGYGIVRAFRLQVQQQVFNTLTATARVKYPQSSFSPSPQFEGPLWQLVTQRPPHLLDPHYPHWEDELLASLDKALGKLQQRCGSLAQCPWGRQNQLDMRHPLADALPFASRWLNMPVQPMPGDADMPRVQGTRFGASERLVVSPGREDQGLFQMPGGPVDHPLSPFYGAGHAAWVRGEPQPLLPGKTQHTLRLTP